MNEQEARTKLPRAYALSLWLRDLGFNEEQIASVLSIEPEAIRSTLQVARLKVERLRREAHGSGDDARGVVVFIDGDDGLIDEAAAVARDRGLPLHLVALHRTVRNSSFGVSERRLRKGGLMRTETEQYLLHAARRALVGSVDAVPHALAETPARAVRTIVDTWGPALFVLRSDNALRGTLERAIRRSGGKVLVLDREGQFTRQRVERRFSAVRRLALARTHR